MTAAELREADARYQEAFTVYEEAREARNAAIREAIVAGMNHREIAEASNLTRGRIGQFAAQLERVVTYSEPAR
jgi:hypothetical protein